MEYEYIVKLKEVNNTKEDKNKEFSYSCITSSEKKAIDYAKKRYQEENIDKNTQLSILEIIIDKSKEYNILYDESGFSSGAGY